MGDTNVIVDARLRGGTMHCRWRPRRSLPLLQRIENGVLCDKAIVRMDAGFPVENTLAVLEQRETKYVARVRNNAVLDELAGLLAKRPSVR